MSEVRGAQKRLGKFYTPAVVARPMTDWALRDSGDRVLDPSYGACAFFVAALARLKVLGARDPEDQIFGVDVDPGAARYLNSMLEGRKSTSNFRTDDFLGVRPEAFRSRMQAIVGNPPYVRHHSLSDEQLVKARDALKESRYALNGQDGYWAYFVLHALHFLDKGGRLALVLPAALLNAN